jgi:hypothetical protein
MTTCTCDNCGHTCDQSAVIPFDDWSALADRLDAGSTVPAGECPECGCFTYLDPTTYTVLLLRPDYIADQYGEDTYLAHVTAGNPTEALAEARREVAKADGNDEPEWNDYACLCIFEGTLTDLNPET